MTSKQSKSIQPLLIQNSSKAHNNEKQKFTMARSQFVCYSIYNIIRYLLIGALIVLANSINIHETNGYIKYCCSCWFVSLSPHKYDKTLSDNTRFDLSYCIPRCVDCNYCKTHFTTVTEAYNQISQCPMNDYNAPSSNVNPNWAKETGCGDNISITTMIYILKSYNGYSWASCIACVVYVIVLSAMIHVERKKISNMYTECLKWIFIYNMILSEFCLYALFKPFQYWTDKILIDEKSEISIKCQVDSIGTKMESVFTYIIIAAIVFVVTHLIIITINCTSCGCGCCCNDNEVLADDATVVTVNHVILPNDCQCEKICDWIQKLYWFISWFIIFPFMAISAVCIFYAIVEMMSAGLTADYLIWYHVIIIVMAVLLTTLSTFDLFVWFRCCYNNALGLKKKDLCLCRCHC